MIDAIKAKKLLEGVTFKPIPEYGDLMLLDEFVESCKGGGLIDFDGSGKYAFKNEMSNVSVYPSNYYKHENIDRDYTHIVWFNK